MAAINPYLTYDGTCEQAFNFYKGVFGNEFTNITRFSDMPMPDQPPMSEADGKKIMHVALPIGEGTILMGSDTTGAFGPETIAGNNFSISVNTNSEDEANKIFKGLSSGGNVGMPMDKVPWGSYFGMLTDKFGINWMVSYDYPKN